MWVWEQNRWVSHAVHDWWVDPVPFARPGPGEALDGLPKYDLTRLNDAYFERLRERVVMAAERGIYVAVMLFQGWSLAALGVGPVPKRWVAQGNDPWLSHPYNRANNINGIDGDPANEGHGYLTHTLALPAVWEAQRRYIRRVIEAVNDCDNVLYEIVNEDSWTPENQAWQNAVIDFIHDTERSMGRTHPVWQSIQWPPPPDHQALFAAPAEAVSPNCPASHGTGLEDYRNDPPPAGGRKVIIADTDHLWGIGGDHVWAWKSVMRGLNPISMDPWEGEFVTRFSFDIRVRDAMGVARELSDRIDFATLLPRPDVSSTRYALADATGAVVIAYQPLAEVFTLDLGPAGAGYAVEWVHPLSGLRRAGKPVRGGLVGLEVPPSFNDGAVVVLIREG
jgi:hypothetical protein